MPVSLLRIGSLRLVTMDLTIAEATLSGAGLHYRGMPGWRWHPSLVSFAPSSTIKLFAQYQAGVLGKALLASQDMPPVLLGNGMCQSSL